MTDRLDAAARKLTRARAAVATATEQARQAVLDELAEHGSVNETRTAKRLGVDRMTVRKWLGKGR